MDNRISLYKLEVFRLTVDLGGVGRAAAHLFLTQPVVSAHIRSLEERVGAQLFEKDGRRLKLTDAGRAIYSWACDIGQRTQDVDDELTKISDGVVGTARVWAGPAVGSYLMPRAVAEFAADHPRARISLQVAQPDHVLETVEVGSCDFGVLITDEVKEERGVVGEVIGWEELVLVAARGSSIVGDSVAVHALGDLPFISSPDDMAMRRLENLRLTSIGVSRRRVAIEFGHPEAAKIALGLDLGVALMFRCAVEKELRSGELRRVQIEGTELKLPIHLVRRENAKPTPIQRALEVAIREAIAGGDESSGLL